MSDGGMPASHERIDLVERRLAALQDAGVDVAALRAQLAFAHSARREGRLADVEAICDEVLGAARRLAELGGGHARTQPQPKSQPQPQPQPSTESLQRVRVSRAQLADEVRGAIDAEVKAQLAGRHGAEAISGDLDARLKAIESRLDAIVGHAADAAAVAGRLRSLDERLSQLEHRTAPSADATAIAAQVEAAVAEALPRQAAGQLREAISQLPTREDLHQIAETLRADLDWRLEKAAAEHGWCSLTDVQASVRKALADQDPGMLPGSQLGRLEVALAEFVQQNRDQQERLIAALAERVAQQTKVLTKRMLTRPEAPPPERSDTDTLLPQSGPAAGDGSSHHATVAAEPSTDRESRLGLDAVPPDAVQAVRRDHGGTTLFTRRVANEPLPGNDLAELVTNEVERALGGIAAATATQAEAPPPSATTAPPVNQAPADLAVIVAAEVGRQLAHTIPVQLPPSDADLARAVTRILPAAFQDETVRTELFAVLALEAAGRPSALGELTGLRRYLKRELQAVTERCMADGVRAD